MGLIAGSVTRIDARREPHIGWNTLDESSDSLFAMAPLPFAYFANGYVCRPVCDSRVIAWTTHERDRFPAAVRHGNTVGVQFHPEKSSDAGVRFVHAFLNEVRK